MRKALLLGVLLAAAGCGGDEEGGDNPGTEDKCVLPEGLECHAWWPDWPDKAREGKFCLPPDVAPIHECWMRAAPITGCDGTSIVVYWWDPEAGGVDAEKGTYEDICVPPGEDWGCTIDSGKNEKWSPPYYTPPECLTPWAAE